MWKIKVLKYRIATNTSRWLANHLPARLKYFAAINVLSYATTGKYSKTIISGITALKAIDRFGKDKNIE